MTPQTLFFAGVALALLVAASIWIGHHLGSSAALAKVKGDAQQLGAVVGADMRAAAQKISQAPGLMGFIEHPIATTEAELAKHHLSTLKSAAAALWDDTSSLAKIAEGQAEIEARAALRAQAAAALARLNSSPVPAA